MYPLDPLTGVHDTRIAEAFNMDTVTIGTSPNKGVGVVKTDENVINDDVGLMGVVKMVGGTEEYTESIEPEELEERDGNKLDGNNNEVWTVDGGKEGNCIDKEEV